MTRAYTYLLLLFIAAPAVWSQECERNMLSVPDAFGYAKVSKGSLALSGGFTVECWIKTSTYAENAGIIEYGRQGDSGIFSMTIGASSRVSSTFGFTTGRETIEAPPLTSPLSWNHVAVTFTPNDSLRLYINGKLVASRKTTATRLRSVNGDSIYFAFSPNTNVVYLGAIDEVRVWSVPRTGAQILTAMPATFLGNEQDLAAYWRFDDDPQYKQFHDFTGRGLNGEVVGSAAIVPAPQSSPVGGPDHPGYMLVAVEKMIDMKTIFCSEAKDTIVHIRNIGPETVEIDNTGFEIGNIFNVAGSNGLPLPPNPTAVATISIIVTPGNALPGEYWDTLIIPAKNVCGGKLRIPIHVRIEKTEIAFLETEVVYPSPFLPCQLPRERTVTLRNTGTRNVTITSIQFDQQDGISVVGFSPPFEILAGSSKKIPVRFEQGSDGIFTDTLRVTTAECNRTAKLGFRFSRVSTDYRLSAQRIDFPDQRLLPGGSVVLDTEIFLINTGTSDIFVQNIAISGKGYRFTGKTKYLYTGDTIRVRVQFESNECPRGFAGELTFDVSTACGLKVKVPLFVTVRGPEFEPIHPLYKLEATCDLPKDTIVGIVNRSGATIPIVNVQFLGAAFRFKQPPLPALAVQNGDTFFAKIQFAPTTSGRHRDTIRFITSPCGFVDIPLEGYFGVGELVLSDTSVDFGQGCDLAPQKKSVTITNTTGNTFFITSRSFLGSTAITFPLPQPIKIPAGESRALEFIFTPPAFGKYETKFSLTDNGCYVVDLVARGIRERATVQWEKDTLQFGERCPYTTSTLPIRLYNNGFADVLVTNATTEDIHFDVPNYVVGSNIAAKSWLDIPVNFHADSIGPFTSELTLVLAPCGDTVRLPLTGIGGPPPEIVVSDTMLNFGDVRVGESDTLCIELRNPSCIPIAINTNNISLSFPSGGVTVTEQSLQELPKNVNVDSVLQLCFVFAPTANGLVTPTAIVDVGTKQIRVQIRGTGVEPDLRFDSSIIDFADVVIGDTTSRQLILTNYGLAPANILWDTITSPYQKSASLPAAIPRLRSIPVDIVFKPTAKQVYIGAFSVQWDNGTKTVQLRGRGVNPGLLFPTTLVDFGDVRLGNKKVLEVSISGSQKAFFPIPIDNFGVSGVDAGRFTVTPIDSDKMQLDSLGDRITYRIQYSPTQEKADTADLVVLHDSQSTSLPLRGRGVQAHLLVNADTVDFGSVVMNTTPSQRQFSITNTGGYPLHIIGIDQKYRGIFYDIVASIDTLSPIAPYSSKDIKVSFDPTKAVDYLDSVTIFADAQEKYDYLFFKGKGKFTPQGDPDIIYSVDDATLRVGDIVDLPIYISGPDASKIRTDSIYLQIKYDPTIAYVLDSIVTENTLTAGMNATVDHHYEDSTVRIMMNGGSHQLGENILLKLRVEALLGPVDSTRFIVRDAVPRGLGNQALNSGLFYVTDCGNYRTNILLKGPYSISGPQPNPANSTVTFRYELGLDGPVTIKLVDELGRDVKTVVDRFERKGAHQTTFSVEELPSGSYMYVISSLEYRESGKLLIAE